MILSETAFNELLSPYLHATQKGRIRDALSQFSREGVIDYSDFYLQQNTTQPFLMQADVLHSVNGIMWDYESGEAKSGYNPAMLISNSCDISEENDRIINQKDALLAPIIPLDDYVEDYRRSGVKTEQLETFCATLRRQEYTNLFYLPPNPINSRDFIVRLDRIYWLPMRQMKQTIERIKTSRFISLSQWAWYLFIVKISIHTCRVPETIERV